jgi:para-nitrobenzyl esterase
VCPVDVPPAARVVVTLRGAVRGAPTASGKSVSFLGIPFAEPPTGVRRFRETTSHACWTGVKDTTAYGAQCPQVGLTGVFAGDEDCLTLNVWVPNDALPATGTTAVGTKALPVMYFIHGGAEIAGASNQPIGAGNLYDGQALADREHVVVVSTNYRLGALGFLAHPALDAEDAGKRSGNYGLLDLVFSLTWVKKNIASFGGDPAHVMVFGESAGAANTCALMATRETVGAEVATTLGCAGQPDVAACFRSKPASAFVAARAGDLGTADYTHAWDMPYGVNVDGRALLEAPLAAIRAGRYNHVPFAIGSNAHEMELFLAAGSVNTCFDYESGIRKQFGAIANDVLARYPCTSYLFPRWAAVDVGTDFMFTCPARRIARAVAGSPSAPPVFRYYYTHVRAYGPAALARAFHTAELPFVFGTWSNEGYVATAAESAMSNSIQDYWSRFATTGDPNGGGAVAWTAYQTANDNLLVLDGTIASQPGPSAARCDYWDVVAP